AFGQKNLDAFIEFMANQRYRGDNLLSVSWCFAVVAYCSHLLIVNDSYRKWMVGARDYHLNFGPPPCTAHQNHVSTSLAVLLRAPTGVILATNISTNKKARSEPGFFVG